MEIKWKAYIISSNSVELVQKNNLQMKLPCHVFDKTWKEAFWRVLNIKGRGTVLIKLNDSFPNDAETRLHNSIFYSFSVIT